MDTTHAVAEADAARRKWAESQIDALVRQREGLDRRIAELKGFIALLEQSSVAIQPTPDKVELHPIPDTPIIRRIVPGGGPGLGASLRLALRDVGANGMTIAEVADRVQDLGYAPRGEKSSVYDMVRTELARLSRSSRSGIVKVAPGRYAAVGHTL
jgi:hypothetical protein